VTAPYRRNDESDVVDDHQDRIRRVEATKQGINFDTYPQDGSYLYLKTRDGGIDMNMFDPGVFGPFIDFSMAILDDADSSPFAAGIVMASTTGINTYIGGDVANSNLAKYSPFSGWSITLQAGGGYMDLYGVGDGTCFCDIITNQAQVSGVISCDVNVVTSGSSDGSGGDFNLRVGRDINLRADDDVAGIVGDCNLTVNNDFNQSVGRNINMNAAGNINIGNGFGLVGFQGAAAIAVPTITGAKGGNVALTNLLTELANYGLVIDATT